MSNDVPNFDEIEDLLVNGIDFINREEMAQFLEIVYDTLDHEGGYVNDPKDPGGETNFGISKRAYPKLDIKSLTKHEAVKIYYEDYWSKYRVGELPSNIRHIVFDGCVNMGSSRIYRIVQKVVNIKGGSLKIDGRVGKNTIAQCKKYKPEPQRIRAYRVKYYADLVTRKPKLEKFYYGWFRRAIAV
tara:strand:+ start:213 stop:770 length:558 start_codon:yes stop_codon:yes gene_type:complete